MNDYENIIKQKQYWRTEEARAIRQMRRDMYDQRISAPLVAPGAIRSAVIVIGCLLLAGIMLIGGCHEEAKAAEIPESRAVRAIIGEAENQGYDGMLAVACAMRNRGTLQGVYGERAPRVMQHKYSDKIYALAVKAWRASANCDVTHGANHWENVKAFGKPGWAKNMKLTYCCKDHEFYREVR